MAELGTHLRFDSKAYSLNDRTYWPDLRSLNLILESLHFYSSRGNKTHKYRGYNKRQNGMNAVERNELSIMEQRDYWECSLRQDLRSRGKQVIVAGSGAFSVGQGLYLHLQTFPEHPLCI